MIIHAVFRVGGERRQLAAFDARVKLLCAEQAIAGACEEKHAADRLHYDFKVEGGLPFPPFAQASGEFPALKVEVEWFDAARGVRGTATIERGKLTAQTTQNIVAAGGGEAVAIRLDARGYLTLALAVTRAGRDRCRGYMLTGNEDALFDIARDAASGDIALSATQGAAEWARAWHVSAAGAIEARGIEPPQPIPDDDFRMLETLAREFVARWIWFGNGPREEIAIEAERYARLGYAVNAANLRSAALHRIRPDAAQAGDELRYATLDPDIAWVEDAIARCWPGTESQA